MEYNTRRVLQAEKPDTIHYRNRSVTEGKEISTDQHGKGTEEEEGKRVRLAGQSLKVAEIGFCSAGISCIKPNASNII